VTTIQHSAAEHSRNTQNGTLSAASVPPPLKGGGTEHSDGRSDTEAQNTETERFVTNVLYRFYGAADQLLYIGITNKPPARFAQHRSDKEWWAMVSQITMETYPNRKALQDAERLAIQTEGPAYNKMHNPPPTLITKKSDKSDRGNDCLVGKFFHTTKQCEHGHRIPEWQGHIINSISPNVIMIEIFDWLVGEPNGQELITVTDFMAKNPILYESGSDMRYSYRHGAMRHDCDGVDRASGIDFGDFL
jgi:hypothetical protein